MTLRVADFGSSIQLEKNQDEKIKKSEYGPLSNTTFCPYRS